MQACSELLAYHFRVRQKGLSDVVRQLTMDKVWLTVSIRGGVNVHQS